MVLLDHWVTISVWGKEFLSAQEMLSGLYDKRQFPLQFYWQLYEGLLRLHLHYAT